MNTEIREFIDETRKRLDELEEKIETDGNIYPCVKISHYGNVVLFTKKNTGVGICVVDFGQDWGGSANWNEECFIPFSGTITYKNGQPVRTEREES